MLNDAFKALSDPTRRRILELLQERDMSAGEIADCFDMAKPSVSHHLNVLKNADSFPLNERDRTLSTVSTRQFFRKS